MERRLAAILAADVVGYSRLMEQDEAGTFEQVRAHQKDLFQPEIQKHRGRVFKLMGDGLLAEFGSVVDAVECAVTLQRSMAERNAAVEKGRQINIRISINLGEVIIDGEDRYGEGINIAARLQQLAEPGGICVSAKVAKEVEKKLAFGFEAMGEHKVKNISEPIAVYRIRFDVPNAQFAVRGRRSPMKTWAALPRLAAALIIVIIGVLALYLRETTLSPQPSQQASSGLPFLAVLPFANMSGETNFDYFADGVTETLIASLSRSPQFRVVARTSSDSFKGKKEDIRQIGRQLGARYIVEGSVQKSSNKMRIVAQLIDASTGGHVWAERYDREGTDALALQDEIAEKVIASIGGDAGLLKKREYERAWGKDRATLEEYDYYLRGHQLFYRFTKEDTLQAIAIWQEGLTKFPNSSLLRIELGWGTTNSSMEVGAIVLKRTISVPLPSHRKAWPTRTYCQ
jgi:adenylate cyclase